MKGRLSYREGDVFGIPLRSGGVSIGVIARAKRRNPILLGYFFPYLFPSTPDVLPDLNPKDAVQIYRFGDLSLIRGKWPILGSIGAVDRTKWVMPKFVRHDAILKRTWLVSYADDDPSAEIAIEPCALDVEGLPFDGLYGAGAVEIAMGQFFAAQKVGPRK